MNRTTHASGMQALLKTLVLGFCVTALMPEASSAADRDDFLNIGDRRQVFIDGTFLAESSGVELRVHPPRKSGEVTIDTEHEWEQGGIGPYSSVLKVGDQYYMWYHAMDTIQWGGNTEDGSICLALSDDGIHWNKPRLNVIKYKDQPWNNIVIGHGAAGVVLGQDGCMVFWDPNAPNDQYFRLLAVYGAEVEEGQAVHLFSSTDGIHWEMTHKSVVTARPQERGHHLDSQNVMFWDDRIQKYVAYVRKNRQDPGSQGRTIARGESETLDGFPAVQDLPIVLGPDKQDPHHDDIPVVDFYMSAAIRYPWADNAYYMFPTAYYHYIYGALVEFADGVPTNAGPLDTQFAASRDGITWERYDRAPFVRLGMKGEFDWASARTIWGLVPDTTGREMYLYYRASDWLHGWDRNDHNRRLLRRAGLGAEENIAVISRLILRRDGFVSVHGQYTGGEFVTPPLVFEGRRLVLNLDTSATGIARVGLIDEKGQPVEGFTVEDCDRIHTCNQINRPVTWKGNTDVSALAGKPVRLRFELLNCDLYAFQFMK